MEELDNSGLFEPFEEDATPLPTELSVDITAVILEQIYFENCKQHLRDVATMKTGTGEPMLANTPEFLEYERRCRATRQQLRQYA